MVVRAGIVVSRTECAALEYVPADPVFLTEIIPFHPSRKYGNSILNIPKNLPCTFVIIILARSIFFEIGKF
jgi:hypothetical protein